MPINSHPDGSRMSASQRHIAQLEEELRHMRQFRNEFMLYMKIWLHREQAKFPGTPIVVPKDEVANAVNKLGHLQFDVIDDAIYINWFDGELPNKPLIILPNQK